MDPPANLDGLTYEEAQRMYQQLLVQQQHHMQAMVDMLPHDATTADAQPTPTSQQRQQLLGAQQSSTFEPTVMWAQQSAQVKAAAQGIGWAVAAQPADAPEQSGQPNRSTARKRLLWLAVGVTVTVVVVTVVVLVVRAKRPFP